MTIFSDQGSGRAGGQVLSALASSRLVIHCVCVDYKNHATGLLRTAFSFVLQLAWTPTREKIPERLEI